MKLNDEITGLFEKALVLIQNAHLCDRQAAGTFGAMALMDMSRIVGSPEYQPVIDDLTQWAEEAE